MAGNAGPEVAGLCPEQVVVLTAASATATVYAALVDPWRRAHGLPPRLLVGRVGGQAPNELLIHEASVSRRHAEITCEGERHLVRDLGSRNGTFVNGTRLGDARLLEPNDTVRFGDVGFVFVGDTEDEQLDISFSTSASRSASSHASADPAGVTLAGSGGYARIGERAVQLASLPFALLQMLADRWRAEVGTPADRRGFVRATEILASLPWDTPYPDENHVKQTVRRLRRALAGVGLGSAVLARQGSGYRLATPVAAQSMYEVLFAG